jgi:hypothetical protein
VSGEFSPEARVKIPVAIRPPSVPSCTAPGAVVTAAAMCIGCFAMDAGTPLSSDLKLSVS